MVAGSGGVGWAFEGTTARPAKRAAIKAIFIGVVLLIEETPRGWSGFVVGSEA
jgi:hypothetical protein